MAIDLLKTASQRLAAIQKSHAGREVTIRRGANTNTATATIGSTPFETTDEAGNVVETFESRDYLIDAVDYMLGGQQVEPQRGDQIDEVIGGTTHTYEVMSPGRGPVFRYTDRYRGRLRIHTKLVGTA
jgi:hypothetical protein